VWAPLLELYVEQLDLMIEQMARGVGAPVVSLHGIDPGTGCASWLGRRLPIAEVEVWADHVHYPHLVDPDRFIARVGSFDPAG